MVEPEAKPGETEEDEPGETEEGETVKTEEGGLLKEDEKLPKSVRRSDRVRRPPDRLQYSRLGGPIDRYSPGGWKY